MLKTSGPLRLSHLRQEPRRESPLPTADMLDYIFKFGHTTHSPLSLVLTPLRMTFCPGGALGPSQDQQNSTLSVEEISPGLDDS
ncbi:hypothetical protein MJO28_015186 [Puccinia striiformis f. sp. tritici]|uniref:Uncharacterized protein n=1 Tax=Puccinia striiformis f. sp. tritici TaxID=168172 RepID=A0ACC0DSI3_9BASI|nr:hypothetical protein MJO29_014954 [Puccinia striiformis f. sp. tritici]KAI7938266.1 hypothetical protein MJO28_015186 [Puccinia striiformis f. sp. tritici]